MQSKDIAILCRNIGDLLIVLGGVPNRNKRVLHDIRRLESILVIFLLRTLLVREITRGSRAEHSSINQPLLPPI